MAYIKQQAEVWTLSGDLLMDNANAVLNESALLVLEEQLTIDFSKVNNIDTSALGLMIAWVRRAKEEFCKITFSNVPDNLVSLAALYGVQDFFHIE